MLYGSTGTDLTYNIVEQLLEGVVDGHAIHARAVSGGRAGTKTAGAENPFLANNPYLTKVKKAGTTPGGPTIMGKYRLVAHESHSNWIRLVPFSDNAMFGRDGFAIHGRGPRGSDGCIVPTDFAVVQMLYKLVKARQAAHKGAPTLSVVAVGDFDAVDKRLDRMSRTA
jgi:hypothetical protein